MKNQNVEKAVEVLGKMLEPMYGGGVRNIVFEHVDESGYWFSYELDIDKRRQTWCVRHWEVE